MAQDLQFERETLDTNNSDDATTRTELMYTQIVSSIVEHRISPGTRFREERLADLFEVSRTQVRKVLQRLEHEGLVARQPRKGVSVATPTKEETKDIFEARRLIEPWIVGQLCVHCSRSKVLGLKRLFAMKIKHIKRRASSRSSSFWRLSSCASASSRQSCAYKNNG